MTQQIETAENRLTALEQTSQKFINPGISGEEEFTGQELRKLRLDFRILSEQLMQYLLHTDAIQTPTEEFRLRRKNTVQRIQDLHKKLDGILKCVPEESGSPGQDDVPFTEDPQDPSLPAMENSADEEEPVYSEEVVEHLPQLDE